MTQEEVLTFLYKHKDKGFTAKQLSKTLNLSRTSASNNIARLVNSKMIKKKKIKVGYNLVPFYFIK